MNNRETIQSTVPTEIQRFGSENPQIGGLVENLLKQRGINAKQTAFQILEKTGFEKGAGMGAIIDQARVEPWSPFTVMFRGMDTFQGMTIRDVIGDFLEKYTDEYLASKQVVQHHES